MRWWTQRRLRPRDASSAEFAVLICAISAVVVTAAIVLIPELLDFLQRGVAWAITIGP